MGVPYGIPWAGAGVPEEFALVGLGHVTLTVRRAEQTQLVLTEVLGFKKVGS